MLGIAAGAVGQAASSALGLLTNNILQRQNFKWSEKAADNAFQRELAMYNRMYEDKSPANVVKQLDAAGLNKGLMFSGGASGVGGAANASSAPQGTQFQAQQIQGANLALMGAQIENVKADTEVKKADAEQKTLTTPELVSKLYEEGLSQQLANFKEKYMLMVDTFDYDNNQEIPMGNRRYGDYKIDTNSVFARNMLSALLTNRANMERAQAEKILAQENVSAFAQRLLNETMQAEAAKQKGDQEAYNAASGRMNAEAQKLAAEFKYGDQTNWKWWTEFSLKAITELVKSIKP